MVATYPPKALLLSTNEAKRLEMLADQLVAETLSASETFVAEKRMVDPTRWKAVKAKNNLYSYRVRRGRSYSDDITAASASPHMPMLYPTNGKDGLSEAYPRMNLSEDSLENGLTDVLSSRGGSEHNVMENCRPARVPMVFCTGIVPGTIEDAALGFFADTEERSRMRNSNNKDAVVDDMRILARIHGPTKNDPFRFLGVKWCAHSTPGAAGCFIKSRDYLIIESTGMALDSDGNRFTYMLNHSIELNQVPDFRKIGHVRINFSICFILKPHEDGEIDVFCQGFVDTGGKIPKSLSTYMFCDGLMIVPQFVEDGYAKKLTWLLRTQHFGGSGHQPFSQKSSHCPCCNDKLQTGLAKLIEGNTTCCICRRTVCTKCSVTKTLPIDVGGPGQLTKKAMDFCLNCYLKAKEMPAWRVAIEMISVTEQE
ncbi:hypothetical protein PHYBOEH_004495 [Phytophthora boehmeriae]|uniref:FYVE-type domain-containing protein n=1 Tax=Phytophthora boehmeriae TaxID=109152 RepID=A0A8T1WSP2_9STRA|nr:hypothetical protein PHYBOEH_004495 [Phytophthora boehmeriae]